MNYVVYTFLVFFRCFISKRLLPNRPRHLDNLTFFPNETGERRILNEQTRDKHKILALPGLSSSNSIEHYAGFLDTINMGKLFYWFFPSASSPKADPLVIWMNGGPGCSSMDGLFIELGPFKLRNGQIDMNEYSWHKSAK